MKIAHFCIFSLLCLCFPPILLVGHEYQLCIGAMFRTEARWMKEWIEYHRIIGVEHFYLYSNDSADNFEEVLAPYIEQGIVDLFSWKRGEVPVIVSADQPDWYVYQGAAYADCVKRALHKTKWLAIIDLDEFIVPEQGIAHFHQFLDEAAKTNIGSYNFSWKCFGNSYIFDIPEDRLMTELLVMRTRDDHPCNSLSKAFYRPEAVDAIWIHGGELFPGYQKAVGSEVRINHYQHRGRRESFSKRWGHSWVSCDADIMKLSPNDYAGVNGEEKALNAIEDKTIHAYLPALQKAVNPK